jgi:hypothetical protein
MFVGACIVYLAMVGAALYPLTIAPRTEVALPRAPSSSPVRLSFITTARSRTPGFRLAQGLGVGLRDVAFRAAVIEHPNGVVVFSAGLAPSNPTAALGWKVWNPFGRPTTIRSAAQVLEDAALPVSLVVLPTLRWYDASGASQFANDVRIATASSERWSAFEGSWPHRYMIDRALVAPLQDRVQTIPWGRTAAFGRTRTHDVFGDGTVVLSSLRGSLQDEVGAIVTLADGERVVLVGDAVWSDEQVDRRLPRTPYANFAHDRNRMQLAGLIAEFSYLESQGIDVIPLLDGEIDLPEYPTFVP